MFPEALSRTCHHHIGQNYLRGHTQLKEGLAYDFHLQPILYMSSLQWFPFALNRTRKLVSHKLNPTLNTVCACMHTACAHTHTHAHIQLNQGPYEQTSVQRPNEAVLCLGKGLRAFPEMVLTELRQQLALLIIMSFKNQGGGENITAL